MLSIILYLTLEFLFCIWTMGKGWLASIKDSSSSLSDITYSIHSIIFNGLPTLIILNTTIDNRIFLLSEQKLAI